MGPSPRSRDGNVVTFEKLGDGIAISETGLASNGSHSSGLNMKPVDLFRHLAPGRVVPDALLADDERTTYSRELPADAVVVSSLEEFEDLSGLDAEQLEGRVPARPEQRAKPSESPAAPPTEAALGQLAAAQVVGSACDTFLQTQCILDRVGLFGGAGFVQDPHVGNTSNLQSGGRSHRVLSAGHRCGRRRPQRVQFQLSPTRVQRHPLLPRV